MADTPETAPQTAPDTTPRFSMRGQYVKDMSIENPHAPASFLGLQTQPKVDLNIDLAAQRLQDDLYELGIRINVRASGERTLFLVDLTYAGIFSIENVPDDRIEGALMVDGALMLFPFARRIVADVTRDAGFPPLMLEPVDFYSLYIERSGQGAPANAAQAAAPGGV